MISNLHIKIKIWVSYICLEWCNDMKIKHTGSGSCNNLPKTGEVYWKKNKTCLPRVICLHLLLNSLSENNTDKRHFHVQQPVMSVPSLRKKEKKRKSVVSRAFRPGLCCHLPQRGNLCNVPHSPLSHWIGWHTVSKWVTPRLWSTRSMLRFCAAVDMATILVD